MKLNLPGDRLPWSGSPLDMAIPSTYLAAENSAAERRSRALHRFIVASPILLLVAIGLVGHLRHRPYAGAAGSADYDRRVLAYRERVAAASALHESDDPPLGLYSQEAARWASGFDSGALAKLPPAQYEDHLQNGVRGEIFRAGINVVSGLTLAAERRLVSGRPAEAAPAALLAARVANGLHGFESQTCVQALIAQRRSLEILDRAWPVLSSSQRQTMRRTIAGLRADPKEVEGMLALEETQYQDYCRRQQVVPEVFRKSSQKMGALASAAVERSVRLSNGRIDALLKL